MTEPVTPVYSRRYVVSAAVAEALKDEGVRRALEAAIERGISRTMDQWVRDEVARQSAGSGGPEPRGILPP